MSFKGKNLFLIYELEHLPVLQARLATGEKFEVVALDYEVELEMKKRGISYTPLRSVARSIEGEREPIEFARRLSRIWYTSPEFSFFQHEGILLGEPHAGPLYYYFGMLIYYVAILGQVIKRPGIARISIPESFRYVSATSDPTIAPNGRLPVEVAQLLSTHYDIAFETVPSPPAHNAQSRRHIFRTCVLQFVIRLIVHTSNILVTILQGSRPIRLLVTDPWSRIEPYVRNMKDVELIMTHRKQMKEMGWKNICLTRARFRHRLDFVDKGVRELARKKRESFARAWHALGPTPEISKSFVYQGISLWPIASAILGSFVTEHAEDDVITIENTKRMFLHDHVNCVLLFSSVKGYNNIIARLTEHMDIPSIETQHATEVTEPTQPYAHLYSRYLASYGPLTAKTYETFGVEPWRLVSCGSPRFDAYARPIEAKDIDAVRARLHLDQRVTAIITIPEIIPQLEPGSYTNYSLRELLEDFSELQKKTPAIRFLLRPRPTPQRNSFFSREEILSLFSRETPIVQYEDLRTLFALTDIVISGNSTVVLEAMLMHRSVLMYLPRKIDKEFQAYEDAGAILVARTKEELVEKCAFLVEGGNREALIERADAFLKKNYSFDGHSAEKVSALIRRVTSVS
ncbi:MAG: CDP-glycerol glycerophosphotransferase family protein [bacterium]|nr:CDP-glycerol glycerophosphotransferase family protein [bacterium]